MEIINREARFNYFVLESVECGVVLTGTEIKSIRDGKCNLKDSYARIRNNEVYLLNMNISEYKEGNIFNHDPKRTRKLLLHKNEILKLPEKERKIILLRYFRGKTQGEVAEIMQISQVQVSRIESKIIETLKKKLI